MANERNLDVSFQFFYLDKNKARLEKHRQLICCILSVFYIYSVIAVSVIIIAPFNEGFNRLRNLLLTVASSMSSMCTADK